MNLGDLTDRMSSVSSNNYDTSVRLMIECLQVIPFQLPKVGISGIELARRYWNDGSASTSKFDLEQARVACWNYLDERSASTNTEQPDYCAMRAVISVLYPDPPSDDIGELLFFFNQMLQGALSGQSESECCDNVNSVVDEFAHHT